MSEAALQSSLPSVTLGEVAESIVDGPFGSNLKTSDYVESGVPVLQGKNITGNRFVWKEVRYISDEKARQLKRSSTVLGDHLLIKIGSIGYSAILDDLDGHDFAIIPANLARIRPDRSVVDDQYLHRVLTSDLVVRHFQKVASKTAQPALSLKKIKATQVPLPPLAEQKRIAGILDAADALRAKRRESLAQLDTFLQSTFLDMFGDPVTNPMGWGDLSLDDCSAGIVDGPFGSSLKTSDYVESGVPVLQGKNITGNVFEWFDVRYITPEKAESLKRSEVRVGDHLLIKIGSIGYSAVLTDLNGHDFGIIPANMARVRRNPKTIEEAYLHGFLTSRRIADVLRDLASKTAQPALNLKKIRGLTVPVPPLDLQRRLAAIVESVEQQKASQRAHLAELDTLFASLQSRAFRGDL